ncbi:hypothetical protein A3K80_08040 [Candidatus Bathyarchaeota archaeon RBG_13_38_9]|nr:MAG: hypothetical protein A3K80_08040 [Candidatus Bathyarchaeota archaeon RBG_13_38_9]
MLFACGLGGALLGFGGGYLVGRETSPRIGYMHTQKLCQSCGANIDASSRYCQYCGKDQVIYSVANNRGAIEILKERYAKGEITTEEFHKMKKEII